MALGATATLIALTVYGTDVGLGVLAGAAVGVGNFRLLRTLMAGMMLQEGAVGTKVVFGLLSGLKFLALVGVVVALLVWLRVDRIGFLVGITAMVVALPLAGLTHRGDNSAPANGRA